MRQRDLIGTNLLINQVKKQTFNIDTILLASYIKIPYRSKVIFDLGTGIGSIPLYLSKKTKAKIIGFEIQKDRFELACTNISLNNLESQITIINQDIKEIINKDIDVIVSNPPFFKVDEKSHLNLDYGQTVARHEVLITLAELLKKSAELLKHGGLFYMIHRPDRIVEIIEELSKNNLTVKRLRFVHPYYDQSPKHVLIEAKKYGSSGVIIEPPLIIYEKTNELTQAMKQIYKGEC